MSESVAVRHYPQEQRFVIQWVNQQAELLYSLDLNSRKINFYRTYVPESARGQGLARKLVETGLQWATTQGYEIEASCSYVQPLLKN